MSTPLPMSDRSDADAPGHWLLARLGKRVLRPGGLEITRTLIDRAGIAGADVVELAPGLGATAQLVLAKAPKSYVGVDADPDAAATVQSRIGDRGTVVTSDADQTGLDDASVDVVLGEAMLTMQGEKGKNAIIAEAARVLRPGGRYAIHEMALEPDTLSDEQKTEIRQALARSIKVNARPLTTAEWTGLLEANGFEVETVAHAPMDLLRPGRNIADEGLLGTLKIVFNVLRRPDARKRVLGMRKVFDKYADEMSGMALIAVKK